MSIDRSWGNVAAKVRFLEEVRTAGPSLKADLDLASKMMDAANAYATAAKWWRAAIQAGP